MECGGDSPEMAVHCILWSPAETQLSSVTAEKLISGHIPENRPTGGLNQVEGNQGPKTSMRQCSISEDSYP